MAGSGLNAGKTLISYALTSELRSAGKTVQTFKIGLDPVDACLLTHTSGRPCVNIDPWLQDRNELYETVVKWSERADAIVIEGVDALDPARQTWAVARILGVPIVLVLDTRARVEVNECLTNVAFEGLRIPLVVLNFATDLTGDVVAAAQQYFTRSNFLVVPTLHDVATASTNESSDYGQIYWRVREQLRPLLDLLDENANASSRSINIAQERAPSTVLLRVKIAVACDEIFNEVLVDNFLYLRELGADITLFSPARGERPASDATVLYFPGTRNLSAQTCQLRVQEVVSSLGASRDQTVRFVLEEESALLADPPVEVHPRTCGAGRYVYLTNRHGAADSHRSLVAVSRHSFTRNQAARVLLWGAPLVPSTSRMEPLALRKGSTTFVVFRLLFRSAGEELTKLLFSS